MLRPLVKVQRTSATTLEVRTEKTWQRFAPTSCVERTIFEREFKWGHAPTGGTTRFVFMYYDG